MEVHKNNINGDADGHSTIRTRLPLEFAMLNHEVIPVILTDISFHNSQETAPPSCEISLEVSGTVGQTILSNESFHLFQSIVQGQPAFEADQPIQLRAALRASITKEIEQSGGDAETVLDALLPQIDSEKEGVSKNISLNETECWLALTLTQNVKLPSGLQNSGELKQGLQTTWSQLTKMDAPLQESVSNEAFDLTYHVESFLKSKQLNYEKVDERILRIPLRNDRGSWVSLIRLEPEEGFCVLYSVFNVAIPNRDRHLVALQLMSENYEMLNGNFEMDDQDGELRFRSTYVSGDQFDSSQFAFHLHEHLQVMEHFIPIIGQIQQ